MFQAQQAQELHEIYKLWRMATAVVERHFQKVVVMVIGLFYLLSNQEGSFSGIQSLVLTIFILPSFRIVTRNALAGWPTACCGWRSRISSILYFNDFSESVPSTKNSSNLGLPKSYHKKEAAASGKRSFHESVVVWYTCRMGKNNERFSIL